MKNTADIRARLIELEQTMPETRNAISRFCLGRIVFDSLSFLSLISLMFYLTYKTVTYTQPQPIINVYYSGGIFVMAIIFCVTASNICVHRHNKILNCYFKMVEEQLDLEDELERR